MANGFDKIFQIGRVEIDLFDGFIQETQQNVQPNAQQSSRVLEWISYDRLEIIETLEKGRSSIIYKAIWSNINGLMMKENGLNTTVRP